MSAITQILAREILDSRGNPTVEVDVHVDGGFWGRAAVPSGASTGSREALELRDGDKSRFSGKGVLRAVPARQRTHPARAPRRRRLGAGGARQDAVRARRHGEQGQARRQRHPRRVARRRARRRGCRRHAALPASALAAGQEPSCPVPMFNILNGGAHADNSVDFQEFMVAPVGAPTFRGGAAHGRRDLPRAQGRS